MPTRLALRRQWLAQAGALSLAIPSARLLQGAEASATLLDDAPPKNAAEALARLKAGNERFVSGQMRHAHQAADWRAHLVGGQQPFATILACADSRVSPELVFDQGFGDLFVIRVAGNVISSDVVGSIAYAVDHLKTPLMIVVGHESCGAVTATIDTLAGKDHEPQAINALLKLIMPGLKNLDPKLTGAARVSAGVEANVRWSLKQLAALPQHRTAFDMKSVELAGGVYDLSSGRVKFL